MLNVSLSPFASFAVGVNVYAEPTRTDVVGEPVIVGAALRPPLGWEGLLAVMANAGNIAYDLPSLTAIRMLPHLPAWLGFPVSPPVVLEKDAQYGLLITPKRKLLFGVSGSLTLGWNEYTEPTATDVAGEPEIFGAMFCASAALENAHATQAMAKNENECTRPASVPTIEICMNAPRDIRRQRGRSDAT